MGSEFQKKRLLAGAQRARTAEAHVHSMQANSAFPEMIARITTAVASFRSHGGVAKGQRRRLVSFFLMPPLGGFASLSVSLNIRPVRRQNVVPTHWVRE
jgi:hypothetical protein